MRSYVNAYLRNQYYDPFQPQNSEPADKACAHPRRSLVRTRRLGRNDPLWPCLCPEGNRPAWTIRGQDQRRRLGYHGPAGGADYTAATEQAILQGCVDLALGWFGGKAHEILAPFELKGADSRNLDAIMLGRNKTPVQQVRKGDGQDVEDGGQAHQADEVPDFEGSGK